MTHLVFFLEEPSAKAMLQGFLPAFVPETVELKFVVFEGKQDLEKRLPIRLRAWLRDDAKFVVLRDKDSGDCFKIKQNLVETCVAAGKPNVLVRIACCELESFYLGDLKAVAQAIGPSSLSKRQGKSKFRDPDKLANPSQELKKIAPEYQKISGSRAIGPLLDINQNSSRSFNALITGIQRLITGLGDNL